MVEQEAVNFEVAGSSPAPGAMKIKECPRGRFLLNKKVRILMYNLGMSGIREVRARGRREGFFARFLERGGKFRLDFRREDEARRKEIRERYGVHFQILLKIIFRGRGGGVREKIEAILATLYLEGKLEAGERILVEEGMFEKNLEEERKIFREAIEELEEIERDLAEIYEEERVISGNRVEFFAREKEKRLEQFFDGEGREEFQGKSAEEYFYSEFLVPAILEKGGREEDIIPQLLFSSLIERETDKRRVDFFVSDGKKGLVIEIDDSTHEGSEEKDMARNRLLGSYGIRVLRIKIGGLKRRGVLEKRLRKALEGFYETESQERAEEGEKPREGARKASGRILIKKKDGKEEVLYEEIRFLYEILSFKVRVFSEMPEIKITEKKRDCIKNLFRIIFGHAEFREGQEAAILRTLEGKDSIVLLPTGSGKSAIYQFLALILPGVGMIVEPLRSLMEDQVENLKKRGIEAAVNLSEEGGRNLKEENFRLLEKGAFFLVYSTPERLQMSEFRKVLKKAKSEGVIFGLVALDEAHSVSEWGHDFRVAYLNLAETAREILRFKEKKPVILALTGTASDSVLKDMVLDLKISETGVIQPETFDRPEIHYRVLEAVEGEKKEKLEEILAEEERPGIIFCVYKTENTEYGVDTVYQELLDGGEEGVVRYYATDGERRKMEENAAAFREDRAGLMVATKAFGMGIDKENVRFTVHYGIPNSIEAYYQEAGRAGRDGKRAMSYIILTNDAPERNVELISGADLGLLKRTLNQKSKLNNDDVNRVLFLHQKSYDKRMFLREARRVLGLIREFKIGEKKIAAETRLEFEWIQKVLYRLKILSVISDYTISNYANNEFNLVGQNFDAKRIVLAYGEYVARYQEGQAKSEMNKIKRQVFRDKKEFILAVLEILVDFTDGIFEASRRRAILNMLQLAAEGAKIRDKEEQDRVIRTKILDYLGNTHQELLGKILADKKFIQEAVEAIKKVRLLEQNKLFGEIKRSLQAYPEHPGLLIVSGFLEAVGTEGEAKHAANEILAARQNAIEKYGVSEEEFLAAILEAVKGSYMKAGEEKKFRGFIEELGKGLFREKKAGEEEFRLELMEILPERFTYLFGAEFLVENLVKTLSRVKIERRNLWTGKN